MFGRGSKPRKPRIETLVGVSTVVHGDLEFSGGLHLDGRVAGSVRAPLDSDSTLSVSEHGRIEGGVESPNVVLDGVVNGDIRARERVVLGSHARVRGNVTYGIIEISLGAEIQGRLVQNVPEVAPVAVGATAS